MLNKMKSFMKKQTKMFALLAGISTAPLAHAEVESYEAKDDTLQTLLSQVDRDVQKAKEKKNAIQSDNNPDKISANELNELIQVVYGAANTDQNTAKDNSISLETEANELASEVFKIPKEKEDVDPEDLDARLENLVHKSKEADGLPTDSSYSDYTVGLSQVAVQQVSDLLKELDELPENFEKAEENKNITPETITNEVFTTNITNNEVSVDVPLTEKIALTELTTNDINQVSGTQEAKETTTNKVEITPKACVISEPIMDETITNKIEKAPEVPVLSESDTEKSTSPITNKIESVNIENKAEENAPAAIPEEIVKTPVEELNEPTNVAEKVETKVEDKPIINTPKQKTKKQELPQKSNNDILIKTLIAGGFVGGILLLQALLNKETKHPIKESKENDNKNENKENSEDFIQSEPFILESKKEEKDTTFAIKPDPKKVAELKSQISLNWRELSKDKSEEELREQGIRTLNSIKLQRASLLKQKQTLIAEWATASEERKKEIESLLKDIALKGTKLSLKRRQACVLIRGEQGERDKEQRRLYAKKMAQLRRLSKKDGQDHSAEMNEIEQGRLAIKQDYKKAIDLAQQEAKKRIQQAGYKQGLRLLNEAKSEQLELDSLVRAMKKETGLKRKKDILEADALLKAKQKKATQKKRQGLKLIKGRQFINQKIRLNNELKAAVVERNIALADQLSKQFEKVQQEQKDYVKEVQNVDYNEERIHLINQRTAQRIREVRTKRARLKKARILRAKRMLYYLQVGKSSAVNTNQMTAQQYRQEALKLLENSSQKMEVSNYPKQRYKHLKEATLAGIYRRQKERA